MAISSVTLVLRSLGLQCVGYLPVVLPLLLHASRSAEPSLREVAVEHLGLVIPSISLHVRRYLPPLLALVQEHLRSPGLLQMHTIALVEALSRVLNDEFRPHLSSLLPSLLAILPSDSSDGKRPTLRLLSALRVFSHNMGGQMHMVIPAVLRVCEQASTHHANGRVRRGGGEEGGGGGVGMVERSLPE